MGYGFEQTFIHQYGKGGDSNAKKRILLVEDDVRLLTLFSEHLQQQGYVVDTATDKQSAMKFLESCDVVYDLVVSDYNFPRSNETPLFPEPLGGELLSMMRDGHLPRYQNVPFILFTGDSNLDVKAYIEQRGGVLVVKGSIQPLFAKITELLA
jgi:CheY-like chemotaxis protein